MKKQFMSALMVCVMSLPAVGSADASGWYVKPVFGLSDMSSVSGSSTGIGAADGQAEASLSAGFNAGFAVGKQLSDNWSVDLLWEYRSNDSDVTLVDGQQFTEGNYASNFFFLNATYHVVMASPFKPFVGAGLGVAQEIDIDLEQNGVEQSLSGSGDFAYQVYGGVHYAFTPRLGLTGSLRYSAASSVSLESENFVGGNLSSLEYNPVTLQMGLRYDL